MKCWKTFVLQLNYKIIENIQFCRHISFYSVTEPLNSIYNFLFSLIQKLHIKPTNIGDLANDFPPFDLHMLNKLAIACVILTRLISSTLLLTTNPRL